MPTYAFRCPECATEFEERRSFSRSDLPAFCPACGGVNTTKVLSAVAFFSPGSAAKTMLEPKPAADARSIGHGSGCPCCRIRPA